MNPPVWRASTILYDTVADLEAGRTTNTDGKLFYGRRGTPTQWALAEALTALEPGAEGTMLFPSGVAAVTTALLSVLAPGDHLLVPDSAYDPTRMFCDIFLRKMGVATSYYDPQIGAGIAALITPKTRVIWLESPGSLTFEVQDIPAIVGVAQAHDLVTIMDNTWASPLFFPALSFGVDMAMMACTKYIVGHSDAMVGSVTANAQTYGKLRQTSQVLGHTISADDAYLALRGLRTLDVRLRRHEANAIAVAHWLDAQPQVARVLHPALPACPGHALWARDFSGASGLFSFVLRGGTSADRAAVVDRLALFGIGYSWGGFESLALPVDPERVRTATTWAAEGPVIRLNIGLDDPHDLIDDLAHALADYPTG